MISNASEDKQKYMYREKKPQILIVNDRWHSDLNYSKIKTDSYIWSDILHSLKVRERK
jgi:hypothetical protein